MFVMLYCLHSVMSCWMKVYSSTFYCLIFSFPKECARPFLPTPHPPPPNTHWHSGPPSILDFYPFRLLLSSALLRFENVKIQSEISINMDFWDALFLRCWCLSILILGFIFVVLPTHFHPWSIFGQVFHIRSLSAWKCHILIRFS